MYVYIVVYKCTHSCIYIHIYIHIHIHICTYIHACMHAYIMQHVCVCVCVCVCALCPRMGMCIIKLSVPDHPLRPIFLAHVCSNMPAANVISPGSQHMHSHGHGHGIFISATYPEGKCNAVSLCMSYVFLVFLSGRLSSFQEAWCEPSRASRHLDARHFGRGSHSMINPC